jgi:hypothetical protein
MRCDDDAIKERYCSKCKNWVDGDGQIVDLQKTEEGLCESKQP